MKKEKLVNLYYMKTVNKRKTACIYQDKISVRVSIYAKNQVGFQPISIKHFKDFETAICYLLKKGYE